MYGRRVVGGPSRSRPILESTLLSRKAGTHSLIQICFIHARSDIGMSIQSAAKSVRAVIVSKVYQTPKVSKVLTPL